MMKISRLQFITNHKPSEFDSNALTNAIQGGVDWVQFRMKEVDLDTFLEEALKVQKVCRDHSVSFIINDHVEIAKKIGADGVHIGKNDIPPSEAREILGSNFIIGGTANTMEDIMNLHIQEVDYIGLGPFKFTTTKKLLSPILGIEGYQRIVANCKKFNVEIPIVAIGGIELEDIRPIMQTGIHGIALSGLLQNAENPKQRAEEIGLRLDK